MKKFDHKEFSLMMKTHRRSLGLRSTEMSDILGLGINQWRLYENDSSQIEESKKKLIEMACRPSIMLELVKDWQPDSNKKKIVLFNLELMVQQIEEKALGIWQRLDKNYWIKNYRWHQKVDGGKP